MANYKTVNGVLTELTEAENVALDVRNAAWAIEESNRVASDIRNHRNIVLAETDWMALSDTTMSPAWASYRQALRDITEQAGFPYSVVWPTKP